MADSRSSERWVYRVAVGGANLALTAALLYGLSRYFSTIVPKYGHRFAYVAFLLVGVAVWTAVRGIFAIVGRRREGR